MSKPTADRVRVGDRVTTVTAVPIGVDYDRIQAVSGDGAFYREQERLRQRFGLEPRSWDSASIGSTTPRAFPSGSRRSTGSSPRGRSCAAG